MTTSNPRALLQWLSLAALVSRGWVDSSNIHTFEAYDESSFADEGKMADEDDMARFDLGIYPGTKYCGQGNVSDAEIPPEQYLAAEDACCKGHDECTHYIDPGKMDPVSRLTNNYLFVASKCSCDEQLFQCLKSVGTKNAVAIGIMYFDGFTRKCFTNAVPLKCKVRIIFWSILRPTTYLNCRNYCTDTSASPAWHWRPTALFLTSNTSLTQPPPC